MAVAGINRLLVLLLVRFSVTSTALAESIEFLCMYPISGQYGPGARYLYYTLVISGSLLYKHQSLVGATIGTGLVISAVAAVHGIALWVVRGVETVDLDIYPVFILTVVGMQTFLVADDFLKRQKQSGAIKFVLYGWMILLSIGSWLIHSTIAEAQRLPCDKGAGWAKCAKTCGGTRFMREGQSPQAIQVWPDGLPFNIGVTASPTRIGALWMTILLISSILWILYQLPRVVSRSSITLPRTTRDYRYLSSDIFPRLFYGTMIVAQIICAEIPMMGPHGLPVGEPMTTVGQWAPIVGMVFLLGGVMVVKGHWRNSYMNKGTSHDIENLEQDDFPPGGTRTECMCNSEVARDRDVRGQMGVRLSNGDLGFITTTLGGGIGSVVGRVDGGVDSNCGLRRSTTL